VPPEVREDRIGYTVLRLEEDGRSATILGFVKKVSTENLALDLLEQALAKGGNGAALNCLREVQLSLSDFNFDKALEEINRGLDEGLFR
jgi:hypothetical protein